MDQALALPASERAAVAADIIASLDGQADPDAAEAWAAEIARRVERVIKDGPRGERWEVVRERLRRDISGS